MITNVMMRTGQQCTRSRRLRNLLLLLSCGCLFVVINLSFGVNLMDRSLLYEGGGVFSSYYSILPRPPFTRKNAVLLEKERRLKERLIVFQQIFENHARTKKRMKYNSQQVCKHPHFDLKHDANKHAYYHVPPLNCSGTNLFHLTENVVKLNRSVLAGRELKKCVYLGIERISDDYITYTESLVKQSEPFDIILQQDFIRIQCFLKGHSEEKSERDLNDQSVFPFRHLLQDVSTTNKSKLNDTRHYPYPYENNSQFIHYLNNSINVSVYNNETLILSSSNMSEEQYPLRDHDESKLDEYDNFGYNYESHLRQGFGFEYTESDFDQFLLHVHPKQSVFERISKINVDNFSTSMNVLIFGLDSMSQLSFKRKLPETLKYLKKLNSVILNGYNIVGDATTAALIPILTGKSEVELPEVRKSEINSENVDVYPLIWKNYTEKRYVTMFAEDEPSIGVFNLRLSGFQEQPTDHYMRSFWLAIWESLIQSDSTRFCTGKVPHHKYMLNYLKDFFVKYDNVSKFAFGFHSELSHWNNNPVEYIDKDLTSFLHFLNVKGFLNNTLLILMGDHGARYSAVRNTVQGKLEERLPMMSLCFPSWFEKRFPKAINNLRKNAERLSTPFDIHETLLDVLDIRRLDNKPKHGSRSMSLLQEIPLNRTCASAGIDTHWCACLTQIYVPTNDKFVHNSATAVIKFINDITYDNRELCAELKLLKILTAVLVIPNEKVLKYKSSKDEDQRIANFTNDINVDKAHYQITIETYPNNGIYESTVEVDFRNETYHYTVYPQISRLDMYGDQPFCVQEKHPDLRKYCFCNLKKIQNGLEKEIKPIRKSKFNLNWKNYTIVKDRSKLSLS